MRLFLGIPVPGSVAATLHAAACDAAETLRPVPLENYHITLAFFGECDDARREKIETALNGVALPAPFTVTLGVPLPLNASWTLDVQTAALHVLRDDCAAALNALGGVTLKEREYLPHVTLLRGKTKILSTEATQRLGQHSGLQWQADCMHLYRSIIEPGRMPQYSAVRSWAFG